MRYLICGVALLVGQGCGEHQPEPVREVRSGGKISRTATDLPIYDPATSGPIVEPSRFGPEFVKRWKQVDPTEHIEAYNAKHGHYPADYAEFKSGVIEPNNLGFPENLPLGMQLQYDEANHKVVVVNTKAKGQKK
jgi:hypothetical protein